MHSALDDAGEKTVALCKVENEVEAQIVADALSEHGIACTVERSHETAYDGLFSLVKPWAIVLVLGQDEKKARDVLAELKDTSETQE